MINYSHFLEMNSPFEYDIWLETAQSQFRNKIYVSLALSAEPLFNDIIDNTLSYLSIIGVRK